MATMPHTTKRASGVASCSFRSAKVSGDARERSSIHSRIGRATNRPTPLIRWIMEAMAGTGNLIVVKSRFTGRLSFTITITYAGPRTAGRLSGSPRYSAPPGAGIRHTAKGGAVAGGKYIAAYRLKQIQHGT